MAIHNKPRRRLSYAPTAGHFGIRVLTFAFGILTMYIEGCYQPSPGVGFVLGMALIVGSLLPLRVKP